ncbi:unnamed protein product [Prorocentrum cordatum]|uniref:Uncharacterized protein n=1 Tax=Prorocentrum cordatum TaxID=2364126 RepID=A0ABN9W422_9DINO|nr:unnamed protein product [Polarella glacialis]
MCTDSSHSFRLPDCGPQDASPKKQDALSENDLQTAQWAWAHPFCMACRTGRKEVELPCLGGCEPNLSQGDGGETSGGEGGRGGREGSWCTP